MIAGVAIGAGIWLWILRRYDRIEPEAIRHLLAVGIFGGLISVLLAAAANEGARVLLGVRADIFQQAYLIRTGTLLLFSLSIGLIEETSKALSAVFVTGRLGDLNEPIDAMIYAMTVGLGFAAFENVLYAMRFGNEVLIARFLWPVPAHMAYAALWGYGLAVARFVYPDRNRVLVMAPSVLLAALVHAIANFLLFLQGTLTAALSLTALAALAILAHHRLKRLVAESPFLDPGECHACRFHNDPLRDLCENCGEPLHDTEIFVTCPCGCARFPAYFDECPECGIPVEQALPASAQRPAWSDRQAFSLARLGALFGVRS